MRQHSYKRLTAGAAMSAMLAIAGIGSAAMPSVASAKTAKPLTKTQIISLIKQFSKPGTPGAAGMNGKDGSSGTAGSVGATGAQGLPGQQGQPGGQGNIGPAGATGNTGPNWTVASNSGLSVTNNALSLNAGLLTNCPATEWMDGLTATGLSCSAPVQMSVDDQNGFTSRANPTPSDPLNSTSTLITNIVLTASVPTSYYINASIEVLTGTAAETVQCQVQNSNGATVVAVATQAVTVPAGSYGDLDIQTGLSSVPPGDGIDVECSSPGGNLPATTVNAGGTLTVLQDPAA